MFNWLKGFFKKIDLFELFFPAIQNVIELENIENDLDRIKRNNWELSQDEEKYKRVKKELDSNKNSNNGWWC